MVGIDVGVLAMLVSRLVFTPVGGEEGLLRRSSIGATDGLYT